MYDCVMPVAGASARMGALKPLLPFGGCTLVETAVGSALGAGCRVLLVVGYRGEEVAARFEAGPWPAKAAGGRLVIVGNERWAEGALGSIQAALQRVEGEAFFVAHADMPFVEGGDYRALAEARESLAPAARGIALFASSRALRGHPVLLPSAWIPEILELSPGGALRDFLSGRPRFLVERGQGALFDVDTPEDYERALSGRLPGGGIGGIQR
jgi:molybdenum cofactor cytidylyltransferase